MIKQVIAIIVLSVLVILTMPYAQQGLQWVLSAHDWVSDLLTQVFSGGETGNLIRKLLALLVMPIGIALIPTIIYWFAKRSWFPYFMGIVWVIWLAQTAAIVILYKTTAG